MHIHFRNFAVVASLLLLQSGTSAQKTPITNVNQLPSRTYNLKGNVNDILKDQSQLGTLANELLQNVQKDLATFDIQDRATLNAYNSTLLTLYLRSGDTDKALALIQQMRGLETKPSARLTSGLFAEIYLKTRRELPDDSSDAFSKAFESNYFEAVSRMPFADIKEYVDTTRAQAGMMKADLVMGALHSNLQPLIEKTGGTVPEGVVVSLLATELTLARRLPLNDEIARALDRVLEKASVSPRIDIWKDRDVTLDPAGLQPVTVAIWDTGIDMTSLPESQRFVNQRETADGRDNDGNGFVDDLHGIAFDAAAMTRRTSTLDDRASTVSIDVDRLHTLFRGNFDIVSGVPSREADDFKTTFAQLKPDRVKDFVDAVTFYSIYAHGTHVAGIAAAGNPAARILAVRMTTPFRAPLPVYTMERAQWLAQMYQEVVAYLRTMAVRVVNMSWRYTAGSIEAALISNNVGTSAAERKALARQMFDVEKNALYGAIRNAADILFVCGSGNENNDADFSEYIPASFNLPNLVTVGAVDIAGLKTSFTTEGKSVDFYAGGHQIESYAPGGRRMLQSGTSMSSPQVANLAAKILAMNPKLKPAEVVALIDRGADPSPEDPKIKLIHPKKTLSLVSR